MKNTTSRNYSFAIYQEGTPNPDSIKFVVNVVVLPNDNVDYRSVEEAGESEFAQELFKIENVCGVFIMNNFVSITKTPDSKWKIIAPIVEETIMNWLSAGKEIISKKREMASEKKNEVVGKITRILKDHVSPQVATHGGTITFEGFEDGVVYVKMKGACAGCPSSILTLKAGVEAILKRLVPEVEAVEANI